MARMGTRRLWGYLFSILSKRLRRNSPMKTAMTKKQTIFKITSHQAAFSHQTGRKEPASSVGSDVKPVNTESTMMPITSSMTAAATMEVPTFVSSLPSSFKAATVTETDVAVKMAP